ncbi:Vacuolar protein sorting-associated protein atg6 [Cymbomonas tetramitiformis]|uniref:Vacuolar protein sorting-associated protein atg6 n=1 Tax=Cymbomonas tetramitiformis TaxID=36881 RepID=A0AAE0H135_9CHLO|nr:Vacuolar protein sorting-associated protein atg6 [Cymbomonas tetramitiformis]
MFSAAPGRLDESFVVLDDNNRSPAQRRGLGGPLSVANPGDKMNDLPNASGVPSLERGSSNNMDDSFVVLPQGSGNGQHAGSPGHNQFFATLSRIFDVANRGSQVDHPVCLECMKQIRQQVDKQIEDVEREVQCYEQCLAELGEEGEEEGITDREFESEMKQLAEMERRERVRLKDMEALQAQADREMLALETEGKELAALEGKYWQEFNEFHFHLQAHQEEAASVLAKIESTCEVLELLRHTNVYNDAFHIWHAGPFGTINNFRLGRLPTVNVEWDEINAAWGQACLLLHTMAQPAHPCPPSCASHISTTKPTRKTTPLLPEPHWAT